MVGTPNRQDCSAQERPGRSNAVIDGLGWLLRRVGGLCWLGNSMNGCSPSGHDDGGALKSPQISHGPASLRVSAEKRRIACVLVSGLPRGRCVLPIQHESSPSFSFTMVTERGSDSSVPS